MDSLFDTIVTLLNTVVTPVEKMIPIDFQVLWSKVKDKVLFFIPSVVCLILKDLIFGLIFTKLGTMVAAEE